jgi:hypothetical protein
MELKFTPQEIEKIKFDAISNWQTHNLADDVYNYIAMEALEAAFFILLSEDFPDVDTELPSGYCFDFSGDEDSLRITDLGDFELPEATEEYINYLSANAAAMVNHAFSELILGVDGDSPSQEDFPMLE